MCAKSAQFNAAANEDDPGTCARNANNVDVRLDGDFCGFNTDGRSQVCGHNLGCNSDAKCQRANDVGGECGTNSDKCLVGLQCVNSVCVKPYSLPDGAPCETNNGNGQFFEACASGYCGSAGVCSPTPTSEKCWRDVDCADARNSACVGATDTQQGACLAVYGGARNDWLSCIYDKCNKHAQEGEWSHNTLQECMTTGVTVEKDGEVVSFTEHCMKPYARYMCSTYCVRGADERNPLLRGGDSFVEFGEVPFKFDCEKQTVTRLDSQTDCNLSELLSNCAAITQYKNGAASNSPTRMIVTALVLSVACVAALL